jgi:Tripartite tricarboxylate transporter TctB family
VASGEAAPTGQRQPPSARAGIRSPARPNPSEWVAVAGWLALGIVVLVDTSGLAMSTTFGPGPRFFAVVLSLPLLALAAVHLVTLVRRQRAGPRRLGDPGTPAGRPSSVSEPDATDSRADHGPRPSRRVQGLCFALLAASLFIYAELLEPLGFLIATALLCWSTLVLLGRGFLRAGVESLVAATLLRWGFSSLLGVQLPRADLDFLHALGL